MRPKLLSSFSALNIVQFLSALNDNIFKLLLIFMLIHIKGPEKSNLILSIAGAIFVIPFILFANIAGTLADRFSKRRIIVIIRIIEIFVMLGALLMIGLESAVGGYIILFLLATQSAIFSPCKFGIIPEIVPEQKISHYNGIMTATTYFAIILGTFLASLLTDLTERNFVLSSSICVVIAVVGALFSFGIEKTAPQASEKRVSMRFISEIFKTLKSTSHVRYLFITIVFTGYFLFMGSYVQLNIIPFSLQSLHLSEIQGGYLFLMTAIGIGLGSVLSGKLSGKEIELGFVPFATLGITATLIGLSFFSSHFYAVSSLLVLLGIMGGFYIVPMESFIQAASPPENRGQNVAAANFISFVGVVFATILLAVFGGLLGLSAATGFFIVGIITLVISLLLFMMMADMVLRLLVAKWAHYFWHLKIVGTRSLGPNVLLIVERKSWLDTLAVMAALPRMIRYIVPVEGRFVKSRKFLYRFLAILPLDREHFAPMGKEAIALIKRELDLNHPVCLMHPFNFEGWESQVRKLLHEREVTAVPLFVSWQKGQLKVIFGKPIRYQKA